MKEKIITAIFLLLVIGSPVFSQENAPVIDSESDIVFGDPDDQAVEPAPVGNISAWDYISMVIILGIIIAVIYGIYYLIKKASNRKFNDNEIISVISTHSLSADKNIHIIDVAGKLYMIGVSSQQISLLSEFEDKEIIDQIRLLTSRSEEPSKKDFASVIQGIFSGGNKSGAVNSTALNSAGFLKNQRERIKKI